MFHEEKGMKSLSVCGIVHRVEIIELTNEFTYVLWYTNK